jgi:hypothetical protein
MLEYLGSRTINLEALEFELSKDGDGKFQLDPFQQGNSSIEFNAYLFCLPDHGPLLHLWRSRDE